MALDTVRLLSRREAGGLENWQLPLGGSRTGTEQSRESKMDERRRQLKDNLRIALNELIRTYADESARRDWGNFLADSLARYADEGTLERVLADIRQELSKGRQ